MFCYSFACDADVTKTMGNKMRKNISAAFKNMTDGDLRVLQFDLFAKYCNAKSDKQRDYYDMLKHQVAIEIHKRELSQKQHYLIDTQTYR